MTTRWPNTDHWQRVVATFRETNKSRWRSAAARRLGCDKRSLRARIDREDLHPVTIKRIDAQLIKHLHEYAAWLQRRADEAFELAKDVMRATNYVSTVDLSAWELPDRDPEAAAAANDFIGPVKPSLFSAALAALLEDA